MSIDVDIAADEDFWGKYVSDLQDDIVIGESTISGTLLYVSDYSSAFGTGLDSGNYIALHCEVPGCDDATITVTVTNPVVLDPDGLVVLRIADKSSQTITVVASKEGYEPVKRVFTLTGLTCNES